MTGAGKVEVTAADREAAADFFGVEINDSWGIPSLEKAFARHRIAAQAAQLDAMREAREALADIDRLARDRIKDGDEMGARCWMIGLVDIERAARTALASLTAAITRISADGE